MVQVPFDVPPVPGAAVVVDVLPESDVDVAAAFSPVDGVAGADVPPLPPRKSVTYQPVPFN